MVITFNLGRRVLRDYIFIEENFRSVLFIHVFFLMIDYDASNPKGLTLFQTKLLLFKRGPFYVLILLYLLHHFT